MGWSGDLIDYVNSVNDETKQKNGGRNKCH